MRDDQGYYTRWWFNFLTHADKEVDAEERDKLFGSYKLYGILDRMLREAGAVIGNSVIHFENEQDATAFVLRWS